MRGKWQTARLDDLCKIEIGRTPLRGNRRYWDEERRTDNVWLSIADLPSRGDPVVLDSKEYVSDEGALLCKKVAEGTLLVSFKLTLGRLAVAGRPLFTNEAIAALTIRDDNTLIRDYLYWYLTYFDWDEAARGDHKIKGKTLNKGKLKEIVVILPPLPEQRRIVALLDEAFEGIDRAIANTEKNLANARELFESYLNRVFTEKGEGWVEKRLGEVAETGAGGTPLKARKEYYEGGTIPWLLSGEVGRPDVTSATNYITELGLANSSAKIFPTNTLLVAMYGATAGEVGILRFPAATNQAVCGIPPNDLFVPEFLYYTFLYRKSSLVAKAAGNAQPNISQRKIRDTFVPVISEADQRSIVEVLDTTASASQRLSVTFTRKLAALVELKQSILRRAFSGELTAEEDQTSQVSETCEV